MTVCNYNYNIIMNRSHKFILAQYTATNVQIYVIN